MLIMNISIPQQIIGVRISLPAGVFITSINRAPELGVPGIGIVWPWSLFGLKFRCADKKCILWHRVFGMFQKEVA